MNFTCGISITLSCLFGISCCNNLLSLSSTSKEFIFPQVRKTQQRSELYSLIDQVLSIFMSISMIEMIWGIDAHNWENTKIIGYFFLSCWYVYRIFHQRQHITEANVPTASQTVSSSTFSRPKNGKSQVSLLLCCEMMLAMSWMFLCMKFFPAIQMHQMSQSALDHMAIMNTHHSRQIIPELNPISPFPWWAIIITLILGFTAIISAVRILYMAPQDIPRKFISESRYNCVKFRHIMQHYLNSICESGVQFGIAYMLLVMIS